MTTEEKQLLMVDFYARLPYGVKAHYIVHNVVEDTYDEWDAEINEATDFIEGCKLYLRPMSSMTEEEEKYINEEFDFCVKLPTWKGDVKIVNLRPYGVGNYLSSSVDNLKLSKIIDWLNAHHFDYRGLIPLGLALEAPEGMYKI